MESGREIHPEVAMKEAAGAIQGLHDVDFTALDGRATVRRGDRAAPSAVGARGGGHTGRVDDRRAARGGARWRVVGQPVGGVEVPNPHGRAARMARNGRALRQLPEVEGVFAAGEIVGEHVRLLAEAQSAQPDAFERDTEMLLAHARRLTYHHFTR